MPLPKELEDIIITLPSGHPHTWEDSENKEYDEMVFAMPVDKWNLLDDLVYGRKCEAENCTLDHPVVQSDSRETLQEDDEEIVTTSLEVLLEKNYDEMSDDEVSIYAQLIAEFSIKEAVATVIQAADNGCVCHGPGHPDQHWSVHDADCPAVGGPGAVNVSQSIGVPVKSTPLTPPKKGSPCDCDGPPNGTYNEHLKGCPAHPKYDPKSWSPDNAKVGTGTTTFLSSLCKHDRTKKFNLNKGLKIKAIAHRDVKTLDDPDSDIGVYLYSGWASDVLVSPGLNVPWGEPAYTHQVVIDWPDFSVPDKSIPIADIVNWMLEQMKDGKRLETACMGGHGRTGTMLALLLVAQGVKPGAAIARVRKNHCEDAIENKKQAEYVAEFYAYVHGNEDWRKDEKQLALFVKEAANGKKESSKFFGSSWPSKPSGKGAQNTKGKGPYGVTPAKVTTPDSQKALYFTKDVNNDRWIASRFDMSFNGTGFTYDTSEKAWVYYGPSIPATVWDASKASQVESKGKEVK